MSFMDIHMRRDSIPTKDAAPAYRYSDTECTLPPNGANAMQAPQRQETGMANHSFEKLQSI